MYKTILLVRRVILRNQQSHNIHTAFGLMPPSIIINAVCPAPQVQNFRLQLLFNFTLENPDQPDQYKCNNI